MQIAVFCLFQCFAEKEYQTESKRNGTLGRVIFGANVIQRTWSGRQERSEEARRQGGAPAPLGRTGHPRGRLVCCLTSTPSFLDSVCSKKVAPEGFIPFGFRLIFLFCETLK